MRKYCSAKRTTRRAFRPKETGQRVTRKNSARCKYFIRRCIFNRIALAGLNTDSTAASNTGCNVSCFIAVSLVKKLVHGGKKRKKGTVVPLRRNILTCAQIHKLCSERTRVSLAVVIRDKRSSLGKLSRGAAVV